MIPANYAYWRENGSGWVAEYDRRKTVYPYLHLQEVLIAEFVARNAPLRVLEYGCGPGRHLRYLRDLPGIEVFGFDQSRSMVDSGRAWLGAEWLEAHVAVGDPTGPLPYGDGAFDLVFTAEVLIHVRPEDLPGRLSEFLRVSSGPVLHVEPSPDALVSYGEHDGCWKHDLVAAYAAAGQTCERFSGAYACQAPYLVRRGREGIWTWEAATLALFRRLETDLVASLASVPVLSREIAGLHDGVDALRTRIAALESERTELELRADGQSQRIESLEKELAEAREAAGRFDGFRSRLAATLDRSLAS